MRRLSGRGGVNLGVVDDGVFDEGTGLIVGGQQGFHFAAQFRVAVTCLVEIGRAFRARNVQSVVQDFLDVLPLFTLHTPEFASSRGRARHGPSATRA